MKIKTVDNRSEAKEKLNFMALYGGGYYFSRLTMDAITMQRKATSDAEKYHVWQNFTDDELIYIYDELMMKVGKGLAQRRVDISLLEKTLRDRGVDLNTHVNPLLKKRPRRLRHYLMGIASVFIGGLISATSSLFDGGILGEVIFVVGLTSIVFSFSITLNPQGNAVWFVILLFLYLAIFGGIFEYFSSVLS